MASQNAVPEGATVVDLSTMGLEEIVRVKETLDEEVRFLNSNAEAILGALRSFQDTRKCVEGISASKDPNAEVLIPLTTSAYVKGNLVTNETVLIDIGTGYFIEVATEKAEKFVDKRIGLLNEKFGESSKILMEKRQMCEVVSSALKKKLEQANQRAAVAQ